MKLAQRSVMHGVGRDMGESRIRGLCVVLASIALACSDPREATEANFEAAANAFLSTREVCVDLKTRLPVWFASTAPESAEVVSGNLYEGDGRASANRSLDSIPASYRMRSGRPMQALQRYVEAGVFVVSEHEQHVRAAEEGACFKDGRIAFCSAGTEYAVPARKYELAPAVEDALSASRSGTARLCYGRYEVERIVRFTEPVDIRGVRASEVEYEYRLVDVPKWARHERLAELGFESAPTDDEGPALESDRAAFVLTNEGWVHEKLYGRRPARDESDAAKPLEAAPDPDLAQVIEVASLSFRDRAALEAAQRRWIEEERSEAALSHLVRESVNRDVRQEAIDALLEIGPSSDALALVLTELRRVGRPYRGQEDPVVERQVERAATLLLERDATPEQLELVYLWSDQQLEPARRLFARAANNADRLALISLIGPANRDRELAKLREAAGLRVLASEPTREEITKVQYGCRSLFGETQRAFKGQPLTAQAQARLRDAEGSLVPVSGGTEAAPAEATVPSTDASAPSIAVTPPAVTAAPEATTTQPVSAPAGSAVPASTSTPTKPRTPKTNPSEQARVRASQLMVKDPCAAVRELEPHLADRRTADMHRAAREECQLRGR